MSTAAAASETPVKEALDILLYDDAQGVRKRKLILELVSRVRVPEYAEEFLEQDGLNVITQLLRTTSGSVQSGLLQVLRHLLSYVNAIEQVADSPDLVDKIYHLLLPPADGSPINLSVAKSTLDLLIVIIGVLDDGHKLVNNAAKHRIGMNMLPYSPLCTLIAASDLNVVVNTLTFMNLIMKKKKSLSAEKAKKLLFRWKECGVLSLMKPLAGVEDEDVQKQLSVFQRQTNFTIPRSWEEAHKYKTQFEEAKRRYDMVSEQLFIFQQQQAKMRLLKAELSRAQEAIRAMSIVVPSVSTTFHPSKRFAEGGGLASGALLSNAMEPIEVSESAKEIAEARKRIFESFVKAPDFKIEAQRILGTARRTGGRADYDPFAEDSGEDFGPPDDDLGPPPPDDDLGPPPPDDDLGPPPPDDDLGPPPPDGATGEATGSGDITRAGAPAPLPQQPSLGESAAGGSTTTKLAGAAPPPPPPPPVGAKVVGGPPPPPPPPPPPGGKFPAGGPPPPPPPGTKFGVPGKAAAAEPKDTRLFYYGPKPQKKMKPLHWDKLTLPAEGSLWNRLHDKKEYDLTFDYDEFETMFSQKEVDAKKSDKPAKPKKVLLLGEKLNQNLSIMLHKLPTIPNIQRAIMELDDGLLNRDALIAIAGQAQAIEEARKSFLAVADSKPQEAYEAQEKFVAMALSTTEFRRRVLTWLFTMEWEENAAAIQKPIARFNEAVLCILDSRHLPYYLGILLSFGNMMNFGNATKGNAPAISLITLTKLDASKDNRGKISLMQHLVNVVKARNPAALDLAEELKPLLGNIHTIKWEDIEKSVSDAEREVQIFQNHTNAVKKAIAAQGGDPDDPFIPKMTAFGVKAAAQLKDIQGAMAEARANFDRALKYLGCAPNKPLKPDEVFAALQPLVERVKKLAADAIKEKKRQSRKGQTIGDITSVVGKLKDEMASS